MRRKHYLVHLFLYALAANYLQSVGIAFKGFACFFFNLEVELSSKSHTTHHTQWVIRESDIRIKRCCYDTVFHIENTIKRVNEFAKAIAIKAYGKGVYSEITTVLIVFKSAILYMWLTAIVTVALFTSANKFNFSILVFHLGCSKIAEHRNMSFLSKNLFQSISNTNTTSHHYHIYIVRGSFEEEITHVATHYITFEM